MFVIIILLYYNQIDPCHALYILENLKLYLHSLLFSYTETIDILKYFLVKRQGLDYTKIFNTMPEDVAMSQGIGSHDIDFVPVEFSDFSTRRVNDACSYHGMFCVFCDITCLSNTVFLLKFVHGFWGFELFSAPLGDLCNSFSNVRQGSLSHRQWVNVRSMDNISL